MVLFRLHHHPFSTLTGYAYALSFFSSFFLASRQRRMTVTDSPAFVSKWRVARARVLGTIMVDKTKANLNRLGFDNQGNNTAIPEYRGKTNKTGETKKVGETEEMGGAGGAGGTGGSSEEVKVQRGEGGGGEGEVGGGSKATPPPTPPEGVPSPQVKKASARRNSTVVLKKASGALGV